MILNMKLLNQKLKDKRKIIFFDLEGTQSTSEIIAIGAVKVTLDAKFNILTIDNTGFKRYVKANGSIGPIVKKLTRIDENLLKKEGITFEQACKDFTKYVGGDLNSYCFITYGDYDMVMLKRTSMLHDESTKMLYQVISRNYFDYSSFVSSFITNKKGKIISLIDAITKLGGKPFENQHDPLCDTQNLILLYRLVREQRKQLAALYKEALANKTDVPPVMLQIIRKLNENKTITPEEYQNIIEDYLR